MIAWSKQLVSKLYLKPYLVVTNTITGVISISIGDVLQQSLEHQYSAKNQRNCKENVEHKSDFCWDSTRTSKSI